MSLDELARSADRSAKSAAPATADAPLKLRTALADYDRLRPLIDGQVRPEGIDLDITTDDIRQFCIGPVYETFDLAEMSLSWYIAARARGEPVVALPVFPLRMAVLGYLYCRSDDPYTKPSDLKGKRIGSMAYRYTVNLWLRGILAEHYGLKPEDMAWVTNETELNNFVVPDGIELTVMPDRQPGELLIAGEVDAVMSPEPPPEFLAGDPRIRRLFPDARAEQLAYFRKTGIYPITHTVCVHEKLARQHPWAPERLVTAFREAQRLVDRYYANPLCLSLPGAVFHVEEAQRDYGPEPWSQGIPTNRTNIETFVRYAHQQGYIERPLSIEELFLEGTLEL